MQSACCDSEAQAGYRKLSCGQKVYMFAKAVLDRPTPSPDWPEHPQVESWDIVLGEASVGLCVCVWGVCRHTCVHTYEHIHVSQCVCM